MVRDVSENRQDRKVFALGFGLPFAANQIRNDKRLA